MKKALFVVAAAVLSCLITGSAIASGIVPIEDFRYSLDPTSTSGGKNDVLRTDISGPTVVVDTLGTDLGLTATDNLNALSNGAADIFSMGNYLEKDDPNRIAPLIYFSVDTASVGAAGDVLTEVDKDADIFGSFYPPAVANGGNKLIHDASALGLVAADNIDALTVDDPDAGSWFFSVTGSEDIQISAGTGSFVKFADGVLDIGLFEDDDIDAFLFYDSQEAGTLGVLDVGIDMALFSLSRDSLSTFQGAGTTYAAGVQGQLSAADILFTDFSGSFSLWAEADEMGLLSTDNIDALTAPEPSSLVLLLIGGLGLLVFRRKRRA